MQSSQLLHTAAGPEYVQLAFLLVFGVILAAFAVVAFSRHLQHREALKLLELGGATEGAAEEVVRLTERWRVRTGILRSVKIMLAGVLVLFLAKAMSPLVPWRGEGSIEIEYFLGFFGVFVIAIGLASLIAYAIWSRKDMAALADSGSEEADSLGPHSPRHGE